LDNELRSSRTLTCFFLDGGITQLQPGFNLLYNEYAWKRVPNAVFFHAIRMAWNNFKGTAIYDQRGNSSASSEQNNADVVWLERWIPLAHIKPDDRLRMTFLHAEVLDIRARAQQLGKLLSMEGSKSNEYPDGWRVVAICGTGSNAPGSTDGHNPRSSLPCGDKVPVGNNFPDKESISQEYQASDVVDKAPQQRAGPFPFETPRIPKSDGLRADPLRHMNRSARGRHFIIAATACLAQASRRPYCTVRREEHPPANVNSYAPRAESDILGCDGCGKKSLGGRRKA
jgi:hypothetical protein